MYDIISYTRCFIPVSPVTNAHTRVRWVATRKAGPHTKILPNTYNPGDLQAHAMSCPGKIPGLPQTKNLSCGTGFSKQLWIAFTSRIDSSALPALATGVRYYYTLRRINTLQQWENRLNLCIYRIPFTWSPCRHQGGRACVVPDHRLSLAL